ncbi:unnamed protein product [Clavelina lepadiformis]|uniref:G-protein coupled receptors family 1 profile domain-containing protein n=1 Tax=Clavelina lepadiformis TaxID=159417 RepID=A0ABP0G3F2_CLALP
MNGSSSLGLLCLFLLTGGVHAAERFTNNGTHQLNSSSWVLSNESLTGVYRPGENYFLPYMVNLKVIRDKTLSTRSTQSDETKFDAECNKRRYSFSDYHAQVYDRLCYNGSLCNSDLRLQKTDNAMLYFRRVIDIYVQMWRSACLPRTKATPVCDQSTLPSYKEQIAEKIPFCKPVACPVIDITEKDRNQAFGPKLSFYDCMAPECKVAFYIIIITDAIEAILVAFFNGLVLALGVKLRFYTNLNGRFALSLATSDAIVGFISHPCTMYGFYRKYTRTLDFALSSAVNSTFYVTTTGIVQTIAMATSLFTLLLLALFRWMATVHPMEYWKNRDRHESRGTVAIVLMWLISLSIGLVTAFQIIPGDRFEVHPMGMTLSKKMDEFYLYGLLLGAGAAAFWWMNFSIWKKLRKRSVPGEEESRTVNNVRKNLCTEAVTNMGIAFSICYMPLTLLQSFHDLDCLNLRKNAASFNILANTLWNSGMFLASRLVVISSVINCIIYNHKNTKLLEGIQMLTSAKRSHVRIVDLSRHNETNLASPNER